MRCALRFNENSKIGIRVSALILVVVPSLTPSARFFAQRFDVAASRVSNEVDINVGGDGFLGALLPRLRLVVAGPFSRDAATGEDARRASVKFDVLELRRLAAPDAGDAPRPPPLLRTGLPFALLYALRPDEQGSWLETTVLTPTLRLGRGNKGSLFVLTRPPKRT